MKVNRKSRETWSLRLSFNYAADNNLSKSVDDVNVRG